MTAASAAPFNLAALSASGPVGFDQTYTAGFTVGNLNGQLQWFAGINPSLFVLPGTGLLAPTIAVYESMWPLGWSPATAWQITLEFFFATAPDDAGVVIDGADDVGDTWQLGVRVGTRQGFDQIEIVAGVSSPIIATCLPDIPHTLTVTKPFGVTGDLALNLDGVDLAPLAFVVPIPFPLANLLMQIYRTGTESNFAVRRLAIAF